MCSTPFGIRDSTQSLPVPPSIAPPQVLNAFRHQRFNTIHRTGCHSRSRSVLNAFRHQRFNTCLQIMSLLRRFPCSTPFGIRDSTLFSQIETDCEAIGAQRLSASEIQHRGLTALFISELCCAQRLSASEIQHLSRNDVSFCGNCRAQRLSASEIQHAQCLFSFALG